MRNIAAEAALAPCYGGDLPSVDDLLARGSFYERLERARAQRAKVLCQPAANDRAFVLDPDKKPWEVCVALPRETNGRGRPRDRTLKSSEPHRHAPRPPTITVPAVRRADLLPELLPPEETPAVVESRAAPQWRRGFGLAVIGAVLSLGLLLDPLSPGLSDFGSEVVPRPQRFAQMPMPFPTAQPASVTELSAPTRALAIGGDVPVSLPATDAVQVRPVLIRLAVPVRADTVPEYLGTDLVLTGGALLSASTSEPENAALLRHMKTN